MKQTSQKWCSVRRTPGTEAQRIQRYVSIGAQGFACDVVLLRGPDSGKGVFWLPTAGIDQPPSIRHVYRQIQ